MWGGRGRERAGREVARKQWQAALNGMLKGELPHHTIRSPTKPRALPNAGVMPEEHASADLRATTPAASAKDSSNRPAPTDIAWK